MQNLCVCIYRICFIHSSVGGLLVHLPLPLTPLLKFVFYKPLQLQMQPELSLQPSMYIPLVQATTPARPGPQLLDREVLLRSPAAVAAPMGPLTVLTKTMHVNAVDPGAVSWHLGPWTETASGPRTSVSRGKVCFQTHPPREQNREPRINPHVYGHLIFDKEPKILSGERHLLQQWC